MPEIWANFLDSFANKVFCMLCIGWKSAAIVDIKRAFDVATDRPRTSLQCSQDIVGDECEELLARASVIALADRMLSLAPWVSEQIHGDTAAPWKTMVHGMLRLRAVRHCALLRTMGRHMAKWWHMFDRVQVTTRQ